MIIGVDGLEWNVVLPLIREGRMPNLEHLMERGVFGELETYSPAKSPAVWATIATGKAPDRHGITDFTWEDEDGTRHLFTSADRRTKAIWNIFTDAGKSMNVVGWWNTFPAEDILGVVVSQANTLEQIAERGLLKPGGLLKDVPGQVTPPELRETIWPMIEHVDRELPGLLRDVFGERVQSKSRADVANMNACAWSVRADESTRRVALDLLADRPMPDCFAIYFGTTDVVAHRFWRFHEPEAFDHPPSRDAIRRFGGVVEDAYAHADTVIGELLAAIPAETNVIVVSDHGMHARHTTLDFDTAVGGRLERESASHDDGPPGLIVAAGPGIQHTRPTRPIRELTRDDLTRVGGVADITPTVLALAGVPVGRDMDGAVLEHVLDDVEPRFVDTHDTAEWLEARGTAPNEVPGAAERIEQLRALGYIGGVETDPASPVTVLIVRHAEKAQDGSTDPELTEIGRRRARALADLAEPYGLTHLFSTGYRRTRQTLEPIAEKTGLRITVIPGKELDAQIRALRDLPDGSIALVSGHSNTAGVMACELAGPTPDLDCSPSGRKLDEDVHDRLFVVTLPPADARDGVAASAQVLSYGEDRTVEAGVD